MSGAVAADRPGPQSEPPGTAELLCALSFGSGLAAAEQMEHGTNTAFVGVQLGHALWAGAGDLEAVFYGALVKDAGCADLGAVRQARSGRRDANGQPRNSRTVA